MWGATEANPQKMRAIPLRRLQVALLLRAGSTAAPGPFLGGGAAVPPGDRRGRPQDTGEMPGPRGRRGLPGSHSDRKTRTPRLPDSLTD